MNAIYRYEVPVDDQWHEFDLTGDVLSVGCRKTEWVEFWALHDPTKATKTARFIVVGTGHPVDETWVHRGTAVPPGGSLVWHLMQESPLWWAVVGRFTSATSKGAKDA